jgi:GT2 family glycosyltransferase
MISIVIVSFRSSVVLKRCLESLIPQLASTDEVIVIENGGDQEILKWPLMRDERVIVKLNEGNLGYSFACNQGLEKAKNQWVLLLNPDAIPLVDSISLLKEFLRNCNSEEIYCVELVNEDGTRQDYYRRFPSVRALLSMFFLPVRLSQHIASYKRYTYYKEFDSRTSFEQPPGAGLVVPKLRTLDEDFFVYGSDLFLCWKFVTEMRQEITLIPAKFYHMRGYGGTASSKDLADVLRIESALGFSMFFYKTKQFSRYIAWNVLFVLFEIFGILFVPQSWMIRKKKARRTSAFIKRKSWLASST